MGELRVLVVATDPLAGAGLVASLADRPELNVVASAMPDEGLSELVDMTTPQAIVVDVGMDGDLSALRAAAVMGKPVLALVPEDVGANDPLRAGGRGVLHRESPADAIAAALGALVVGQVVVDPTLPSSPIPDPGSDRRPAGEATSHTDLTGREVQVLRLVADGLANKAIAARLGITDHTVKYHLNSVLSKLGAQNRTEAVTIATRRGLITF